MRLWIRPLNDPARSLKNAMPRLPLVNRQLETVYLAIQNELERLSSVAKRLVGDARVLVEMASGRETGKADVERTVSVLETPLEFLSAAVTEMPLLASELAGASETVAETIALEGPLRRTLAPLRFVQTMFRVESVALPAESRDIFVALAAEIGGLVERVAASFGRQFQTLNEIGVSLRDAARRMEQHHREHVHRLTERRAEIESTVARMVEEVKANARRNIQLTEASDDFSAAVNNAIMALQTQDIVSQRLQHAASGLREAAGAIDAAKTSPDAETLGKIVTLTRIEVAQVGEVIAELRKSEAALRAAVALVGARIGGLDEKCLLLNEFEHITVSVDGVVQVLIESLGALREMTAETLEMVRRNDELLQPADAALRGLTTSVDEVARSMRRIALNAQIRAVQIGERTGLEVLSSRTAEIARDTLRISDEVGAGLSRCAAGLAAGIERLHRLLTSGERALETCNVAGAAEEEHLHKFRDETLTRVRGFGELVDQARAAAENILARIDLNGSIEVLGEIQELVKNLAAAAARLPLPAAVLRNSAGEGQYTMQSERAVHRRVLLELGAEVGTPAPQDQPASNVELF